MDELRALRAEDDAVSGRKCGQLPIALPTLDELIYVFHKFLDDEKILLAKGMLNFLFNLTIDDMQTYLASLENWDRLWAYAIVRAQQLQNARDKCRLQSGGALNLHEQVEHYGLLVPRMEAIADTDQMILRCAKAVIAIFGKDRRKEVSGLEASLRKKFDTATLTEHTLAASEHLRS